MSEDISPVDVYVGMRLRLRRTERGLSVQRMAPEFSKNYRPISWQQLQKYERGVNRITSGRLWELAQFLDVPVNWFFQGMPGQDVEGTVDVSASSLTKSAATLLHLYSRMSTTQQKALRQVAASMISEQDED